MGNLFGDARGFFFLMRLLVDLSVPPGSMARCGLITRLPHKFGSEPAAR